MTVIERTRAVGVGAGTLISLMWLRASSHPGLHGQKW
jgi:hypothetical protein